MAMSGRSAGDDRIRYDNGKVDTKNKNESQVVLRDSLKKSLE